MQTKLKEIETKTILRSYKPDKQFIINALHDLQNAHPQYYIDEDIMIACTEYFNQTRAYIYGIVTYYSMFSLKPRAKNHICLCKSPVCTNMGVEKTAEHLKTKFNISPENKSPDGLFSMERVECLGRCGKAPSMIINKEVYTGATPEKIDEIINNLKSENNE